jgi:HEAT repeat protein
MKRFGIGLGVLLAVLVIGIMFVREKFETQGDRTRITLRLHELRATFEADPEDERPLKEIVSVLRGDWSFARTGACVALGDLGPIAAAAIPDLIDALDSGDGYVEREAARALLTVAQNDPRPVPALTRKLQSAYDDAAWFSAEALGNIGRPAVSAIPALEIAAMSRDPALAESASAALAKLRPLAQGEESQSEKDD